MAFKGTNPGRAIGQDAQIGVREAKASKAGKPEHSNGRWRAQAAWKARNPLATWSQSALRSALRKGLLKREPCRVCGAEPADAHHADYERPLSVEFLCRKHHRRHHAEKGVSDAGS
jgi:hypothetical protein